MTSINRTTKGIFIGLATLDYIYYIDNYPENNHKTKTNDYRRYVGGPAANAAITYSLLGGDATLYTCLGNSNEAIVITEILREHGVSVVNCAFDESLPNIATITVDNNGNRTIFSGQNKFRFISIPDSIDGDFALFDLNQQEISLDLLNKVNCPVVLDAGSWKDNSDMFINKADIVISSETFKSPSGKNIFEMESLSDQKKAITRGEKDILTTNGSIPVEQHNCIDSLGAGDIFHGAFCYAMYNMNQPFEDALSFAGHIASESIRYQGPREWAKHINLKNKQNC